jgi:hypothetical protein
MQSMPDDRSDIRIFPRVVQEEDTKIEGAANFIIIKEDHTLSVFYR